jgi:hypothetical protein
VLSQAQQRFRQERAVVQQNLNGPDTGYFHPLWRMWVYAHHHANLLTAAKWNPDPATWRNPIHARGNFIGKFPPHGGV